MAKTGLVGGSYTTRSIIADSSRTINWYPELIESERGPSGAALYTCPGFTLHATVAAGLSRGHHDFTGRHYTISYDKVYELTAAGAIVTGAELGVINPDNSQASISSNRYQVLIISGGKGYILTPATNALAIIADADFPGNLPGVRAIRGFEQDGYFFVLANNNFFYISDLNDGTAWNPIDTSTIEFFANKLVASINDHTEVFVFARAKGQGLYNSGDPDFPFTPIRQANIEFGVSALDTLVRADNSFNFMGENSDGGGMIFRMQGYDPKRISDHGIENRLQTAIKAGNDISLSTAWNYKITGHEFYVLNIPGLDTCPVYDAATQLWHEIAYWNTLTGTYEPHRGINHIFINGKHLIGDRSNGLIYELDLNTYTDNGSMIRRLRRHPQIHAEGKRLVHDKLRILMGVGKGLAVDSLLPGYDPQLSMRYSDDGGMTYSDEESCSTGLIGEFSTEVEFRGLGSTEVSRVYELIHTDPVDCPMMESYLDVRLGA